jgi:predicted transcriptional regulator
MQVMEQKELLRREKGKPGTGDRWSAAVGRAEVSKPILRRLTEQVFGGRPSLVMQQLLDADSLDPGEIEKIRELLADYDRSENETNSSREDLK